MSRWQPSVRVKAELTEGPLRLAVSFDLEVSMPGKAVIQTERRIFNDFFKVDELVVSHEQIDGTMSSAQRRLVFERGDAVAVLPLNLDSRSVVLVEQFKVPTLMGRRRDDPSTSDGWILEIVAGMIDANETPEAAIVRETMEETGYRIRHPTLIGRFFSSPGGTSERIFLYFAEGCRKGSGEAY
jgi:nudix-type nucleoside diphosphatase (YffH/AdpP family)